MDRAAVAWPATKLAAMTAISSWDAQLLNCSFIIGGDTVGFTACSKSSAQMDVKEVKQHIEWQHKD